MVVMLGVASSQSADSQAITDDEETSSEGGVLRQQLTNLQSYVKTLTKSQLNLLQLLQRRPNIGNTCCGKSLYTMHCIKNNKDNVLALR